MNVLGSLIKEHLKNNGISQIFLSSKTGINKNRLNQMLNGKVNSKANDYILICCVLNVSCDFFVEGGGENAK